MRRLSPLLSGLIALTLLIAGAPVLAQSRAQPRQISQFTISGLTLTKYPDIATSGRTVHIGANRNRSDAVYLSKADTAQSFSGAEVLGSAPGQPDFSPVSVAAEADGTVHMAWINQQTRQLLYRNRPAGGAFGPTRTITTSSGFPASINVGVDGNGVVYVAWRLADQPHRVVRSTDDGVNWSSPFLLGSRAGINFPFVVTGPGSQAAVVYTSPEGDSLQIFAAIWNGSSFNIERITPLSGNYADPTGAFDTDGNLYVAYRGVEGDANSGVWLATRQSDGQWQRSRIAQPSIVNDMVNVQTDPQGNLHLSWIATVSRQQQVFYAFRPRGGTFSDIVAAPNPGGSIFNSRLAANIGDESYGHVISEFFQGDGGTTSVRYYLFGTQVGPIVKADPVIEDNKEYSERKTSVLVTFNDVQGDPTQLRWRWGAAHDDNNDDSGGWQPFSNPITIPVPERILDAATCSPVMLFTQVRNADGAGEAQTDDIIFDTGISGSAVAINPYSRYRAPVFDPAASAGLTVTVGLGEIGLADIGTEGANDGDPAYTRVRGAYVEVRGPNDCSGLKSVSTGRSLTTFTKSLTITDNAFAGVIGYPGSMTVGENPLIVRVADQAGNFADFEQRLIYDPNKPVLTSSSPDSLTATSNPSATVLVRLDVRDVTVSDAYPGRGFWGVWVANSRTPVADPATNLDLRWSPIPAPGTGSEFSIEWSLGSGLPASQLTPGTYYIYMRFLDGAGNATDGVISTTLEIDQVTKPTTMLPLVRK